MTQKTSFLRGFLLEVLTEKCNGAIKCRGDALGDVVIVARVDVKCDILVCAS